MILLLDLPLPPCISCLVSPHRCFVIAAFVRLRLAYLAFFPTSRFPALGFLAKTPTPSVKPNIRFLVVARLHRYGRCPVHPPPRHITPTLTHTNTTPPPSTFPHFLCSVLFVWFVLYIVYVLLYHHHFPVQSSNAGPRAAWLLSTIVMYLVRYRRALVCRSLG